MLYRVCFLFILIGSPFFTHAQISITEIMYDHEGGDTDREWVEIHNTSTEDINISQWFFKENEVNHGLFPDGFEFLDAGEYAVIVQDLATMRSLYGNDINLIKSSFSLNNSTEELAITNTEKTVISSLTYSSNDGAQGDGNSLHYYQGSWFASAPSPGSAYSRNGELVLNLKKSTSPTKKERVKKEPFRPYFEAEIIIPEVVLAGSPARIKAEVTKIKEYSELKKLGGVYEVNFGDGVAISHKKKINTEHQYVLPGVYVITFRYYESSLSKENAKDPDVKISKEIRVINHDLELLEEVSYGSLSLRNNGPQRIDMSRWRIDHPLGAYFFPQDSSIASGATISIPFETLGIYVFPGNVKDLILYNSTGRLIFKFTNKEEQVVHSADATSPKNSDIQIGPSVDYVGEYLEANPSKQRVDLGDLKYESSPFVNIPTQSDNLPFVAGGFALISFVFIVIKKLRDDKKKRYFVDIEEIKHDDA